MKKFNLFLMASAATALVACSDYVGELDDQHDDNVAKIEEAQIEKDLECICDFASMDWMNNATGAYDMNSGVGEIRWTVSGCKGDFSIDENPDDETGFADSFGDVDVVWDDDSESGLLTLSLNDAVKNGLAAGVYNPYLNVEYNNKKRSVGCAGIKFVEGGKSSSSTGTDQHPSEEVSSSSENVLSSSSEAKSSSSVKSSSSEARSSSSSVKSSSSVGKTIKCGDLWCGPEDVEGKVMIPGQSGDYSGYWEEYNDNDNLNGNSRLVFPNDVDTNTYGSFYGPLIEAYGGIKAYAQMGRAYMYPFAGVQFPIVDDKMTGGDISDWGGICFTYYSEVAGIVELIPEDQANYTNYDNYTAVVPKSSTVRVLELEWSKFKQESWGKVVSQNEFLKKVAAVGFKFSKEGDFALLSVGRKGTCTTDAPYPPAKTFNSLASIVTPILEGSAVMKASYNKCGDLWCGLTDVDGRVIIPGSTSEYSGGYWYDFDDAAAGGTSKIEFPKNVEMFNAYSDYFYGNLVKTYKGFAATASIGTTADNDANYAGIGFNIFDDVQSGGDIASWEGLCMAYASDMDFRLEVVPENEPAVTSYDNYGITLNKSQSPKMVNIKWNDLEREGWGSTVVSINEVVKAAARIRYMFRESGDFKIFTIGRYGTCDGSTFVEKPCGDIWCGRRDAGSPAYTGFSGAGAGRMFTYDDGADGGNSVVTLNSAIAGTADNFVPQDEVIDYSVTLGNDAEYPYAGFGISIKGDGTGGDISSWGGICVTYGSSVAGFLVELVTDDESVFTQYNNFIAGAAHAAGGTRVENFYWSRFNQEPGWGQAVNRDDVLQKVAHIKFKSTTKYITDNIKIYEIGRLGTCSVN
ncbi:MAG: hypothetical protein MJY87_00765 [Fibrobacter sp.]|nr:hypothetical protein [Fibrobacter sp.]